LESRLRSEVKRHEPALRALAGADDEDEPRSVEEALTGRRPYRRQPGPNVENVRSSSQAKRDVVSRPKGGKK
jgi:hypothetical protein